ncbi:hypothetical protein BDW71DRAFT_190705 [Aspergillus fruticulosus]
MRMEALLLNGMFSPRDLRRHVNTQHITQRLYESTKANCDKAFNRTIIWRTTGVKIHVCGDGQGARRGILVRCELSKRGLLKHIYVSFPYAASLLTRHSTTFQDQIRQPW